MSKDNRPYRPNVGIMLLNNDMSMVWVGSRIDMPSPYWQMPQGGVDDGEDIETAMWRELMEEIGVSKSDAEIIDYHKDWIMYDLPQDISHKLWDGKYRGQKQKWFVLRLTADDSVINIATDEPEFNEWKWSNTHDLIENIVPFKKDVYKQIAKDFSKHLK
ncbi:MAG: RNA pyrophosphohydrolase [Alphaproteobacteria bacterium]